MDYLIKVGKYVSMLLRHHPEKAGIVLDENGWADVLVLFKINAKEMYKDGYVFYKSVSGVWLTDCVPTKYLEKNK